MDLNSQMLSAKAADKLVRGEPGGALEVGLSILLRASLIATGLRLAGLQDKVFRYALAGSAAVEISVILNALAARNAAALQSALAEQSRALPPAITPPPPPPQVSP